VSGLDSGVTKIDVDGWHTCATHNDALKCWGYNGYGQLGDGTSPLNGDTGSDKTIPTIVNGFAAGAGVTDFSVGSNHTCAVKNGLAQCWGYNAYKQLGISATNTTSQKLPVDVAGLAANVTQINAGFNYTCAIHAGVHKCWGQGQHYKLGVNNTSDSGAPVSVVYPQ